ncbi:protein IQ-DOMAIN 14-like [Tripterygium wilfordii]|nr:protein IQ-DOMAIN 14-like [Tripterygium wilfordii]
MLMGKRSGSSWFTIVRKAFRSPSKESNERTCRRREEQEQDGELEEKKREKRRWLFRKQSNTLRAPQCEEPKSGTTLEAEERQAIAVAAATAEAAMATTQAAVKIVRLARRPSSFIREHYAAIVIQTAFRGYIARRALRALKGIVKLQALVRGYNVRKQAKLTLKCIEALVRVQEEVRDQRARLSLEGSRKSMFSETNGGSWDSRYLQDIRERKSLSRDAISVYGEQYYDDRPRTSEKIEALLHSRKEAALKREKALAYALSNQIRRSRRNPSAGDEMELGDGTRWLDRWMATKQFESRASTETREPIKTLEVDMSTPYSYSTPNPKRTSLHQKHSNQTGHYFHQTLCTPSPRTEKSYSVAHTPSSAGSRHWFNGGMGRYGRTGAVGSTMPNYMAATASTKARVRPQSAPRQRPSTPERERERERERGGSSARKRLSYPAPEPIDINYNNSFSQNLRSPSFKSVQCGYYGVEQHYCYADSFGLGGQISPCSTTDLRWLK